MMKLLTIDQEEVKEKRVLVRGDIDVPLQIPSSKSQIPIITDDTRLQAMKPMLEYLIKNEASEIILCGHIGRPEGKVRPELSTKPVQEWISGKVGKQVRVLENLRFDPREEANDESFARELAAMADIYINEAFAACEREHASIVGVPKLLPHYAGFRLAEEVEKLSRVMDNPERPMLVIIGGAKLETKLPVITKMVQAADEIVVGGKLLGEIKDKGSGTKIHYLELTDGGKDVTLESIDANKEAIADAATIVWNGPMGVVEDYTFQVGTRRIAELVASNQKANKIIGGGDTIGFVNKLGLLDKFQWVSTGGGSMLKFLAGEKLPGIEALYDQTGN
ncbi:phosphoglycerate kinase [Patescibacteria group bacterium]|nr:phosphoglycerate kinase [Patescibacteria group bacterium]